MSYLVVKTASNGTPESFVATTSCEKPRLAVSGSYIPLTTNLSGGGQVNLKVKNSTTTYRLQRYTTWSSSSSTQETTGYSGVSSRASYYSTTSTAQGALSSITNLTRASTSATLTRASTSATLTRASTSATLTRASTSATAPATAQYVATGKIQYYMTGGPGWASTYRNISNPNGFDCTWINSGGYTFLLRAGQSTTHHINVTSGTFQMPGNYPNIEVSTNPNTTGWFAIQSTKVATTGTIYYTRSSASGYATTSSISGYATRSSASGYATRSSVSGYAGSLSRQSNYNTTSPTQGNMSSVTALTSSASASMSTTTWM